MRTGSLFKRILQHANFTKGKWYNFGNYFSAMVVPDRRHAKEIEGILIAALPTANSSKPRIRRIDFPAKVKKALQRLRRQDIEPAMHSNGDS